MRSRTSTGRLRAWAPDRDLVLVGAVLGEHLGTVVEDAGRHLGGRPVAVHA